MVISYNFSGVNFLGPLGKLVHLAVLSQIESRYRTNILSDTMAKDIYIYTIFRGWIITNHPSEIASICGIGSK
jgi:hypothetical protein